MGIQLTKLHCLLFGHINTLQLYRTIPGYQVCVALYHLLIYFTPLYNHKEKADFLYFEVEAPKGINFIMSGIVA